MTKSNLEKGSSSQEIGEGVQLLAKGTGINLLGKIVGRGVHVFGQILLARILGPVSFGLYAIGWNILRLVNLISPLGLESGVIRFGTHHWETDNIRTKNFVKLSIAISLISGLGFGAILFLGSTWLAGLFGKPELAMIFRWIAIAIPIGSGLKVAASATRITKKMEYSIYSEEISQPLSNLFLLILVFLLGWGLVGAVAASVISFAVGLLISIYQVNKLFIREVPTKYPTTTDAKTLLTYSIPIAFAGLFGGSAFWVDRILVGYFTSSSDAGIYQAAVQLSLLFSIILSSFNAVLAPLIVDLYKHNNLAMVNTIYKISVKWGLYFSVPLFLVMTLTAKEVMEFAFGVDYILGGLPLSILAFSQLIKVATGGVGIILVMTGRQKLWLYLSAGMLILNVTLNLILIPQFNLVGAALASSLSIIGLFVVGLLKINKELGLWPYDRRYYKGFVSAIFSAASILWYINSFNISSLGELLIVTVLSTGVFGTILLLLGLDHEDKQIFRLILDHLKMH